MRVNGAPAIYNVTSSANLNYCPYYTVPDKIGCMCVSPEHVQWFSDMMEHFNSYLEIGTFDGIALSLYAERWPGKRFAAIDSFEIAFATGNGHYEYFFENCKKLDNIDFHWGRSSIVLPQLRDKFDVIFIDGAHDEETIRNDYLQTWRLLNVGGRLIFHDINLEGTLRVISEVERNHGVQRQTTPVGVLYVEKNK